MYLIDFENGMFGEPEYGLASTYYSKPLSPAVLDLFEAAGYNKWKVLFYAVCRGIRKVFLAGDNVLAYRINRLEQMYQELSAI